MNVKKWKGYAYMVQDWFDKNLFTYAIIGIFAVGVLLKFITALVYRNLIKNSQRIGTSENKLMKTLRLKFETCYKLKLGVNNVDIFVDKYVYRYKICGLYLYTWDTLCGLFNGLCLLAGSGIAVLGLAYKCGRKEILSTFIAGGLACMLLIVIELFLNFRVKRSILKTNMKDYLINYLKVRLEDSSFDPQIIEQYRKEYFSSTKQKGKEKRKKEEYSDVQQETAAAKAELNNPEARREAKKNELRKMIQADKEENKDSMSPIESSRSKRNRKTMEPPVQEKTKTVKSTVIKKETEKIPLAKQEKVTINTKLSKEEEKVIEDILKEYLA